MGSAALREILRAEASLAGRFSHSRGLPIPLGYESPGRTRPQMTTTLAILGMDWLEFQNYASACGLRFLMGCSSPGMANAEADAAHQAPADHSQVRQPVTWADIAGVDETRTSCAR